MDEWIKNTLDIHTHTGIWFSHTTEGSPAIYNKMDGPWAIYVKWIKERQWIFSFICEI